MTPIASGIETSETIQTLLSRHSVRTYKKDHQIPEEKLRAILEIAGHAPSAWNLQHWKFLVVQEQADKEKLLPIAYNQKQVLESSVTIVVLGDTEANRNAEIVYNQAVEAGKMPAEAAERIVNNINQTYANVGVQFGINHAYMNAGLVSMQLMIAAKGLGYDSVPMSGFDPAQLVKEFQINTRYIPTMLVSIGLSDEPSHQSPRLPLDDIIYKNA